MLVGVDVSDGIVGGGVEVAVGDTLGEGVAVSVTVGVIVAVRVAVSVGVGVTVSESS